MGLDMYAWKVKAEDAIDPLTIRSEEAGRTEKLGELAYWRKHHDLHGWMEKLYYSKGGNKSDFNCVPVQLTSEDLKALSADLKGNLPRTTGFFFGNNPPNEDSVKNDRKFIAAARKAIKEGFAVYYDSWW